MAKGHINDGHIISKTKATKIGKRLLKLIENKTVDRDVNEHTLIMEKAKANNDILDKQKENLIEALKIGCRKYTKVKTGKKPFTNINIIKI